MLILQLTPQHRARNRANNTMSAHLITSEVSCRAAAQRAHQAAVALALSGGVGRSVLLLLVLAMLRLLVLALWVLVLCVGALLRELVVGG